jgi:LPS export ABC transporter protein LptC
VNAVRFVGRTAAALALAAFAGCARAQPPAASPSPAASASAAAATAPPTAKPPASAVPIQLTASAIGSHYLYLTKQRRNRKIYVLRADSEKGHYFGQDTGLSEFVNPHVTFFGTDGKRLVADAPAATVSEREKSVLMTGGVRARSQDGMTLRSDTLRYNDANDVVHAEGNVVVTTLRGERLEGSTLDWNLRDGSIDVNGAR